MGSTSSPNRVSPDSAVPAEVSGVWSWWSLGDSNP